MTARGIVPGTLGLAALTLVAISGCETLHNAGVPGFEAYAKVDQEAVERERKCRDDFTIRRDYKALYWLLAHRIGNGMKLEEVENVLGESGEFTNDFKIKDTEGLHQLTDVAYKWGPDSSGRSVVIWFRDGQVCNFNPKYYRNP